ncbi:MAG: hypothetical protein QOI38_3064 [Sphingomonadales bacterium]|jgi:hypothetical protein|nr:hypothetical protein [Sphingomonadales bacterium]
MIAVAAFLLVALQPPAAAVPTAPEAPVVAFRRALTFAELALQVARQRICARPARERRVAALYARMRELLTRARPAFGDIGEPLSIVEGERGGPDCGLFGRSAGAAERRLDEAEAILASAARGAN